MPIFWENFKELFGNSAKATLATNNLILSEQNLGRIQTGGEMHISFALMKLFLLCFKFVMGAGEVL